MVRRRRKSYISAYLRITQSSNSQRRAKCTATCRSRLRTRLSSTQSESPKAGVGMNQIVGCYLALNSGFGGCQIVLIHVLGGCQIVLIRLKLGVSAF